MSKLGIVKLKAKRKQLLQLILILMPLSNDINCTQNTFGNGGFSRDRDIYRPYTSYNQVIYYIHVTYCTN